MWLVYSLLSAIFGGMNGILAKFGLRKNDPAVVTALRTAVVLVIAWGAVGVGGAWREMGNVDGRNLLFLLLSGTATAFSWLFYFRAMKGGAVNRVAAVDKLSIVLTMLGGWMFLGEPMSTGKIVSMCMIAAGILLMIREKSTAIDEKNDYRNRQHRIGWLIWALLSVCAVTVSALLSKLGVEGVDSRLALGIRTSVVLIVSALAVGWKASRGSVVGAGRKTVSFIALSGAATGFGWLFFFRALSVGDAGRVYPLDKLSVLVTAVLSRIFLGERLSFVNGIGLMILSMGIALLAII